VDQLLVRRVPPSIPWANASPAPTSGRGAVCSSDPAKTFAKSSTSHETDLYGRKVLPIRVSICIRPVPQSLRGGSQVREDLSCQPSNQRIVLRCSEGIRVMSKQNPSSISFDESVKQCTALSGQCGLDIGIQLSLRVTTARSRMISLHQRGSELRSGCIRKHPRGKFAITRHCVIPSFGKWSHAAPG